MGLIFHFFNLQDRYLTNYLNNFYLLLIYNSKFNRKCTSFIKEYITLFGPIRKYVDPWIRRQTKSGYGNHICGGGASCGTVPKELGYLLHLARLLLQEAHQLKFTLLNTVVDVDTHL